ncbi:MAG: hypothetical protein GY906_23705 [bacterium]|nr:hypothetical protein [bacterium]
MAPELFSALSYHTVGPSRGGRVTTVAGHRDLPSTFYMGASGGGVWKTSDFGVSWANVSDGFFATGSVGAIQVADSDPDIIYVGTGSDGLRSNVIIGKGAYKSTDAGLTWVQVGLERVGNIGAILIHPDDPDLVYVAAIGNPFAPNPERGVFKTTDGGQTWRHILFVSDTTGAVDLEFAPDNPEEVYATLWHAERKPWTIISGGPEGGVFKSDDGGESWRQLNSGLPKGLTGKADLAVSGGDPNRVYVLIEAPKDEGGVYRSDDRGETWCQVSRFDKIQNRPFYYCNLEAHPSDPDVLWSMAEGFWKSEDAGDTWSRNSVPHGDNHDMWINPDDPDLFIQANDGGANVTHNGGETWSSQYNQPTAELYQVDVSDGFPYRLYAGQQDNSTISVPSYPPRRQPGGHISSWEDHGGCETGPVVPKPGDPDIVYANCKGRFGLFNRRTGQEQQHYVGFANLYGHNPKDLPYRFQRVAPIHVSPHNPDRVYHASQYVHVTEDGGRTWQTISPDLTAFTPETQVVSGTPITIDVTGEEHFSTIYEVQESPHESGVIWVGANDGPIHLTRNGGKTWTQVTPSKLGPYGRVQTIEVSPHQPSKAYVSVLRYQLGDFRPHAYKTEDYGASWARITTGENGIPNDYPVRVVREDPDRQGLLYAGTEFGLFVSFDDGERWQPFQLNLPVTPVTDIKIVHKDLVLSTMGRGFWILSDLTPLHEVTPEIGTSEAHLFAIRDTYRIHPTVRTSRSTPRSDRPQHLSPGANIRYWFREDATEKTHVEIRNADGVVVRRFDPPVPEDQAADSGAPNPETDGDTEPPKTDQLAIQAGMHSLLWNLRYDGPYRTTQSTGDDPDRPKMKGPMVPPGTYTVTLFTGDWSTSRPFELALDPRVVAEGIVPSEVQEQAVFALTIRDDISTAHHTHDRIDRTLNERNGSTKELLDLRNRLIANSVRYSQPMLIDQLEYLYRSFLGADQSPTQHARARYGELHDELSSLIQQLDQLIGQQDYSAGTPSTSSN